MFSQFTGASDEKFFFRQLNLAAELTDRAETEAQFSEPVEILDDLSKLAWLADNPGHAASLLGARGMVLVKLAEVAGDSDLAWESVAQLERATRMFAEQGNAMARDIYAEQIEYAKRKVETIQSSGGGTGATTT